MLIPNPRIANQRVKMLPFSFTPGHIPGKTNVVPDTLSRAEPDENTQQPVPTIPIQDVLDVQPGYSETYGPPEWVAWLTGAGARTSKLTQDSVSGITFVLLVCGLG